MFSVSNEVPEHPVVSPVSGCIYERRLIEKYISENGTDPMNGEKLNAAELVDIKSKIFTYQYLIVILCHFVICSSTGTTFCTFAF